MSESELSFKSASEFDIKNIAEYRRDFSAAKGTSSHQGYRLATGRGGTTPHCGVDYGSFFQTLPIRPFESLSSQHEKKSPDSDSFFVVWIKHQAAGKSACIFYANAVRGIELFCRAKTTCCVESTVVDSEMTDAKT